MAASQQNNLPPVLTVKQLMAQLQGLPEDAQVWIWDYSYGAIPVHEGATILEYGIHQELPPPDPDTEIVVIS